MSATPSSATYPTTTGIASRTAVATQIPTIRFWDETIASAIFEGDDSLDTR